MPKLSLQDPYDRRTKDDLDEISDGLSGSFHLVSSLPEAKADRAVECVLRCVCRATHARPIMLGREYLLEVERPWLIARIERIAALCVDMNDEWDFRRLLELYRLLDRGLVSRLVEIGLRSSDIGIVEAAQDFSK